MTNHRPKQLHTYVCFLLLCAAVFSRAAEIDDAWQKLPSYRVGTDRACVLQLDTHIAQTASDAKPKAANAARLAKLLSQPKTTDDATLFICQQLARLGGDAEVPALATVLKKGDKRSTQMACAALIGIGTDNARATLRDALDTAEDEVLPDLLHAVGALRDPEAVPFLGERLKTRGDDAALCALAEIATELAADILLRELPVSPAVMDARLRCAERLGQQPDARDRAHRLYESLWEQSNPVHYRAAALSGLVETESVTAACRVISTLRSDNARLAGTAARLLPRALTEANFEQQKPRLVSLPPEALALAVEILAEQGFEDILPLVVDSLNAESLELRAAAVRALGHLGNADHVKTLTELATAGEKAVADIAIGSLAALTGHGVDAAIKKGLAKGNDAACAVLIGVAARRRTPNLSPVLLAIAGKIPALRRDVYAALSEIGTPGDCPALLTQLSTDMDATTLKALEAAIATLTEDGTPALANAWKDTKARAGILRILARRGGETGLRLVRDALDSGDKELRREAIRALSSWSDAAAVDELLKLAKAKDDEFASTMAVRGLMTLVDRTTDIESRLAIVDTLASLPENAAANDWAEKKRAALLQKNPGGTALKPVPARSAARKQELDKKAPKGYRLVTYLDCGPDISDGAKGEPTLRVRSGAPYVWGGAERHADVRAATIVYTGNTVALEASGLDPKKSYKLGLTWWDYDHDTRAQTVALAGKQVLKATKLPSYKKNKAMPAVISIDVPGEAYPNGTMPIAIGLAGGVNVVLSEIWLYESDKAPKVAKPAPPKPRRDPNAKRVLLITGEDYKGHKWQQTAPVLRDELAKDTRIAVDMMEDLKLLRSVKLDDYAAIVMHFKNYAPEVPGRAGYDNLASFVQKGGGLVLVHFACGAFQEFKEDFEKVAGRVWNPKMRGHDPFGTFTVNIVKPGHPTMLGLKDFETTDELYTCLDGDTVIDVLATAVSKVDKKTYPMAFVLKYGKGQVFHSPLGHDTGSLSNPPVAELFRQGTAWVAGLETK